MKFNVKNFKNLIFFIIYKLSLDLSYIIFVSKFYEYAGFYLDFNKIKYLFSLLVLIVIFMIIPKAKEKPSSIFINVHFIVMIIPILTIYAFMDLSTTFFTMIIISFIFQIILLKVLSNFRVIKIKHSNKVLYSVLFAMTSLVYIVMIAYNGMPSINTLNILNVYEFRGNVSYPMFMGYLVPWQAKIINPFLIATSYYKKNRKILLIATVMQVLLYMLTGQRSFLFIIIAIFLIMKVVEKGKILSNSSKFASIGIICSLAVFIISKSLLIPSITIRRLLFVPAINKFYYFDFFSNNNLLFFSGNRIGDILGLKYEYPLSVPNLIGQIYMGNPETNANTGYLADAYANLGFFGMIVFSLIFVVILKIIDSLSFKVGKEITIGLSIFSIMSLNDVALLTSILTGGLGLLIIVLYLYSNVEKT